MSYLEHDQQGGTGKKMIMNDAEIILTLVVFSILFLTYLWWRGL